MKTVAIDFATESILAWMRCITSDEPMKGLSCGFAGATAARRGPFAALVRAEVRRTSSTGLTRKSCAPARIASIARLTEPWAVSTITRVSGRSASMARIRASPSPSGSTTSNSTMDGAVAWN